LPTSENDTIYKLDYGYILTHDCDFTKCELYRVLGMPGGSLLEEKEKYRNFAEDFRLYEDLWN
jgi:hypothetical protein